MVPTLEGSEESRSALLLRSVAPPQRFCDGSVSQHLWTTLSTTAQLSPSIVFDLWIRCLFRQSLARHMAVYVVQRDATYSGTAGAVTMAQACCGAWKELKGGNEAVTACDRGGSWAGLGFGGVRERGSGLRRLLKDSMRRIGGDPQYCGLLAPRTRTASSTTRRRRAARLSTRRVRAPHGRARQPDAIALYLYLYKAALLFAR